MIDKLNFEKLGGLVPAIVQDARTSQVLMVGFMNREAIEKTLADKKVTFWSRTNSDYGRKAKPPVTILNLFQCKKIVTMIRF